jgi:flagellar hook-associated protein 3 FlgL
MRITHGMIYNSLLGHLNRSTVELHELNLKASSQKRINRPSDDPFGTYRVLSLRDSLNAIARYQQNVSTAKGWLGLADETLMEASNALIRARALAEQAATGTMTADNREQIAAEARQLFEHMINLSNVSYEGKTIFSGHKVDNSAFVSGLAVTSNDSEMDPDALTVTGNAERTVLVQFTSDGTMAEATFRYSKDGGRSWVEVDERADPYLLDLDGLQVRLDPERVPSVTASADPSDSSGTWLWVRPAAFYQGDDEDPGNVRVETYGSGLEAGASGVFAGSVMVRIEAPDSNTIGSGTEVSYSYSLDGGRSWTAGRSENPAGSTALSLAVPGGFLELTGAAEIAPGEQFVIRPNRAKIQVEISSTQTIQINTIGKDVFGGIYNGETVLGSGDPRNIFETLGRLVGFLETNNQQGIQQSLEDLGKAQQHLVNRLADVGARENRLESQERMLSGLKSREKAQLSGVEDVDLAELMTEMARAEIIYQAVLRSSATIMRMSLMNYI